MDLGRSFRRSAGSRCLVQLELLSLGARELELTMGRSAKGNTTRAGKTELGSLDWPRAVPALPPRVSSRDVALLVGLWQRHDGRSWRSHTGRSELVVGTWSTVYSRSHFLWHGCRSPPTFGHRYFPFSPARELATAQTHLV